MTATEIERAVVDWFNETFEAEPETRVRPLDHVQAQAGPEGEADVLGHKYRTVQVTVDLFPDGDPAKVAAVVRDKLADDPHLSGSAGTDRVFQATLHDVEKGDSVGLGPRLDFYLSVSSGVR